VSAVPFPDGACDTHMHVYDGRFPVAPDAVLFPPDASVAHYRSLQSELGLTRVVVVQPTTYGLDNRLQLEAVDDLGPEARAVVVVDADVAESELDDLTEAGTRGARFHLLPGGAVPWESLGPVAARVHERGWHIQLQLDGRRLAERLDALRALPTPLVVDHIGLFAPPAPRSDPNVEALLTLIETGRCWVKLSAPYLSSASGPPDYADVGELARALVGHAPERMLWASNWPHPGVPTPPPPSTLASLLAAWAGDDATARRILVDNPAEVYGFGT